MGVGVVLALWPGWSLGEWGAGEVGGWVGSRSPRRAGRALWIVRAPTFAIRRQWRWWAGGRGRGRACDRSGRVGGCWRRRNGGVIRAGSGHGAARRARVVGALDGDVGAVPERLGVRPGRVARLVVPLQHAALADHARGKLEHETVFARAGVAHLLDDVAVGVGRRRAASTAAVAARAVRKGLLRPVRRRVVRVPGNREAGAVEAVGAAGPAEQNGEGGAGRPSPARVSALDRARNAGVIGRFFILVGRWVNLEHMLVEEVL